MRARHRLPQKNKPVISNSITKKLLLPVILLVLIKIGYFLSFTIEENKLSLEQMLNDEVSAQEEQTAQQSGAAGQAAADNESKKYALESDLEWNLELIQGVKEREAAMRIKEEDLQKEEERLKGLKADIENRLDVLAQIEKRITELIESKKTIEDEKMRKLAKVFESTPPEQAGPLMSKLDIDIAAQLLLKMQGRKAGRIWGFVEPDKAVKISKELARLEPGLDMNKISEK